jgi:hypothetical protein
MKIDLIPFDSWSQTNQKVAELLNLNKPEQVKSFIGAGRALLEVSQSLAQFYTHKRSIAVFSTHSPICEPVLQYFYREGYDVQKYSSPNDVKDWVSTLKKDTCFVLSVEDHPFTGQVYENLELNSALESQRLIHLRLSHALHLRSTPEDSNGVSPFTVQIRSFGPNTAVALLGDRVKAIPVSGSISHWNIERFLFEVRAIRDSFAENSSLVKTVESSLPEKYFKYFDSENTPRVFDRIVFYSQEIGGEMLQHFLASKLDLKLALVGFEREIETLHLCRWGGSLATLNWWTDRPENTVLRGLMALSLNVAKAPELESVLREAQRECRIFSE